MIGISGRAACHVTCSGRGVELYPENAESGSLAAPQATRTWSELTSGGTKLLHLRAIRWPGHA